MRFGLYLVRRGYVAPRDLVAAFEKQQRELPRLGQLAIEEGMLTAREVFEVMHHQTPLAEERFGERAVELGLLTRREVAELLMVQSDRCRPVAEVLVERGVLSPEEERQAREAYHAELERGAARFYQPGPTDVGEGLPPAPPDLAEAR